MVASAAENCLVFSFKFSSVNIFMCSLNHVHMQQPTLSMFLVRRAFVCLVMDKELWNIRVCVFTNCIFKSIFSKACMYLFHNLYVKLTLFYFFYFQFLNDYSGGSSKLQRPKEIIMKLYVFLVNTGTTLTFDTELAVQK